MVLEVTLSSCMNSATDLLTTSALPDINDANNVVYLNEDPCRSGGFSDHLNYNAGTFYTSKVKNAIARLDRPKVEPFS